MKSTNCLALLVLLAVPLSGCTTPGVACDMRTEYASEAPMTETGNVRIAWRFNAEQPAHQYGVTDCAKGDDPLCLVRLKGAPPKFDDVCGLAKFGHEVAHAMGAAHN